MRAVDAVLIPAPIRKDTLGADRKGLLHQYAQIDAQLDVDRNLLMSGSHITIVQRCGYIFKQPLQRRYTLVYTVYRKIKTF